MVGDDPVPADQQRGQQAALLGTSDRQRSVGCNVIEVRDGLIRRERDYWDNLTILAQLGVAEAPAPAE